MNVIVTTKKKTPYCIGSNEKTIYCALRRGIDKKNYTLQMHPNFIYWLTRFTVKYIRKNNIEIICPEEYTLTFKNDILTTLTRKQIEEISKADSRMTIMCIFLLHGFAKVNDNALEVTVNQHNINTMFKDILSIEKR